MTGLRCFAAGACAAAGMLIVLIAATTASHAAVVITDDRGGRIGTYIDRFEGLRAAGETVVIDGLCASACTIVLGTVPHERICVTPRARLGFHAAWDPGPQGRQIQNVGATRLLMSLYPVSIRRWISRRGGLRPQMIFLGGPELTRMYRPCYMDASANARPAH